MANDQQFPTGVYKCSPTGKYPGNGGRRNDLKPAANQAELDVLLGDGWSLSLTAAEDAFDLTKPAAGPAAPSTSTPEERAAAALALEAAAADRFTEANDALVNDQAAADFARSSAAATAAKLASVTTERDAVQAKYLQAKSEDDAAQVAAQAADKTLASSKVRRDAADRSLDDASGKVLTMSSLLDDAKKLALDKAVAKQKALAAAQTKDAPPAANPNPPTSGQAARTPRKAQ